MGFVSGDEDPFIILDIDAPAAIKGFIKGETDTQQRREMIKQYLSSWPEEIQRLTETCYTEFSMSGAGLHVIMRADPAVKERIEGKYSKIRLEGLEGQINLRGGVYMVCTQDVYTDAPIQPVDLEVVSRYFQRAAAVTTPGQDAPPVLAGQLISLDLLSRTLRVLPIDQSSKVKRAWQTVTKEAYQHYDFWKGVGMALYDYGEKTGKLAEALTVYNQWSAQDIDHYDGEEAIRAKWESFASDRDDRISYRTLMGLFKELEFDWPDPIFNSKTGINTKQPVLNSHRNFEYLMEHFNIEFFQEGSGLVYFRGDDTLDSSFAQYNVPHPLRVEGKIMGKFYGPVPRKNLGLRITSFLQANIYGTKMTANLATELINAYLEANPPKAFNLIDVWLQTPFEELPLALQENAGNEGISNLETIASCIPSKYPHLVRSGLRAFFYSFVKMQVHYEYEAAGKPFIRNSNNTGMLIFIGQQATRKTTFFKSLLPQAIKDMYIKSRPASNVTSGKGLRDFDTNLWMPGFTLLDEFDQAKPGWVQNILKQLLTDTHRSVTPIYETVERTMLRLSQLCGATNEERLPFADTGNRRMWAVPVDTIDTNTIWKINWHYFYRQLRTEIIQHIEESYLPGTVPPWDLTADEIDAFEEAHRSHRSQSNWEIVLEEVYNVDLEFPGLKALGITNMRRAIYEDNNPHLASLPDVIATLASKGYTVSSKDMAALKRSVGKMSAMWTGYKSGDIVKRTGQWVYDQGQLCQGRTSNGKWQYHKYLVPAVRQEFMAENENFED